MSSITAIIDAFSPVSEKAQSKVKSNQMTAMDLKIINLAKRLQECQHREDNCIFGNFEIVNTHLSHCLSLLDLKTLIESNCRATDLVITYLKLQQNLDKIAPHFSVTERIKKVSESLLSHVSLFYLQMTGFVLPVENSPVWFALAPDDKFLNRQIYELKAAKASVKIIAAKIKDIETQNADLLNTYRDKPLKAFPTFGTLKLTLGKFCVLSEKELNNIANKLPLNVLSLFSHQQIKALNFTLFSGELLDKIMAGDGTDKDIAKRLNTLSPDQLQIFLKKSSGCHFSKFPNAFYKTLSIATLTEKQIQALFNDDYGRQTEQAKEHLHLVSPQEICKGFHLLPEKLARMLSYPQLASLDYSNINEKQIYSLFSSHNYKDKEEHKKMVQIIPIKFINDVIKINSHDRAHINSDIIASLSGSQYQALNTTLLNQSTVQNLFPGFTKDNLHPGYICTTKSTGMCSVQYQFKLERKGFLSIYGYSKKELEEKLSENKSQCQRMAKNFSCEQLRSMIPLMYPECQKMVKQFQ